MRWSKSKELRVKRETESRALASGYEFHSSHSGQPVMKVDSGRNCGLPLSARLHKIVYRQFRMRRCTLAKL